MSEERKKRKNSVSASKLSATKIINMAEGSRSKKQKVVVPTTTTKLSAKLINVATRIILNDAKNGFKNGNFVCSPVSIEAVLGMVAAGARGKTLKQLLEFLGHETIDQLLYDSSCSKLLQQIFLNPEEGGLSIILANGIWVDKAMNCVQSGYNEILTTFYKTKSIFLDFKNKPEDSADIINSWAKKKTRGLIPTIVNGSELTDSKIVLANALYFKGLWSIPFEVTYTKNKDFHLINGGKVSVPFMTHHKQIKYGSFSNYKMKIVKLNYEESKELPNKLSMYIFLPYEKDGLHDLVQVFDSHNNDLLSHIEYKLSMRYLNDLWIPKFKISCNFEPKDVMKQMGLTLPFEPLNMDLTRMVDSTHPDADKLYVSNILQKSFIEVDEKGTEAACVTSLCMEIMCARGYKPPPPETFVADHPFMFMIRDDISRAVLFLGVVLNPELN